MKKNRGGDLRRGLGALAAAAAVALPGCAETEIQGNILDEDINTPEVMIGLARGMASEFEDAWVASGVMETLEAPTDAWTNDNNGGEETTVGDFRFRQNNGGWAQVHEASWAAIFARERFQDVYEPDVFASSPLAARVMMLGGMAERMLGEQFCELIYNYGLEGGILLKGENPPYDPSRLVPRDSAFKRAIAMFEIALEHAEAAIATSAPVPEEDEIFDPEVSRLAALGGMAQAYANLGDWDMAVQFASQVPDDFEDYSYANEDVDGGNDFYDAHLEDDEWTLYGTQGAELWADDPRLALQKCGDWRPDFLKYADDPTIPLYLNIDGTDTLNAGTTWFFNNSNNCVHENGEYRSESNRYPMWVTTRLTQDFDVPIVSGVEMRLIEAEAAILNNDMAEFKAQIDRARAVWDLPPITQPTEAGELEYPNAEDDAWSILDRERYLGMFLQSRRFYTLGRWNHPYLTDDHVNLPRLQEFLVAGVGRMDCQELGHPAGSGWGFTIPDQECDTNSQLTCPNLVGGG